MELKKEKRQTVAFHIPSYQKDADLMTKFRGASFTSPYVSLQEKLQCEKTPLRRNASEVFSLLLSSISKLERHDPRNKMRERKAVHVYTRSASIILFSSPTMTYTLIPNGASGNVHS